MVEIDNSKLNKKLHSYLFVLRDIGLRAYGGIDESVYDDDLSYEFDDYFTFAGLMSVFTALLGC